MYQLILLIHVFVAICLVALVLVQQGKGATMGAGFGGGASQTIFGARGSGSFLFRLTISFIAVFFITSISLNYLSMHAYKQSKVMSLPVVPRPSAPSPIPTPPTTSTSTSTPSTSPSTATPPAPVKNNPTLNEKGKTTSSPK